MRLLAISLTQPWATLMALEEKDVETRSWATKYRGPVVICAAKSFPRCCREMCDEEPFRSVLAKHGLTAKDLPLGTALCVREIVDCLRTEDVAEAWCLYSGALHEKDFGDYAPGRYGFVMSRCTRTFTPPIPMRGALGLWPCEIPDEVLA